MITLLYFILIYILLGAVIYLIAVQQSDKTLTLFKQELFLLLGFIFRPIILIILSLDNYIIPAFRKRRTIKYINKQYNKMLKNEDLSDEERQNIIHKRDTLINFLNTIDQSETEENEE
jgi:hypothetical protein